MYPEFMTKKVLVTSPAAILDNAAATTNLIDTFGYHSMVIDILVGATDIAAAVCRLTAGDLANASDQTAVSGTDIASSVTDAVDNTVVSYYVPLTQNPKRYWDLDFTAGNGSAGTFVAAIATLYKAEVSPVDNTGRGNSVSVFL
jgi:hypothetical protein